MQNVSLGNTRTVSPATETALPAVKAASRISYIDMLRGFLIALVIVFHAACTYNGSEDWTFTDFSANDEVTSIVLYLFVLLCQSFFMGLYFFLSGVFTPASYDKKGPVKFWIDRAIHLGIPMLLYTLVLSRIPNYLSAVTNWGMKWSFWEFSWRTWWYDADAGPTWFIFAVLGFSLLYTLLRLISKPRVTSAVAQPSWTRRLPAPSTRTLLIVAVGMAAGMFAVCQFVPLSEPTRIFDGALPLLFAFFPFYTVLFFGGVLAARNRWLESWNASMLKFWGKLAIAMVIFLPLFLIGTGAIELGLDQYTQGFTWRCAVTCLWLAFACISFGFSLTLWMREKVKPGSKLATFAGTNSFAVYLIHPIILVAVSVYIFQFAMHPAIKFLVASVVAVPLCFLASALLRAIPGVKKVL